MTKQQNVFDYIVAYKKAHDGNSPSIRHIKERLEISSTSMVAFYLDKLEESGLIAIERGKHSAIKVIGGKWIAP